MLLLACTDPQASRGFVPPPPVLLLTHTDRRLPASCIFCGISSQRPRPMASPSCRRRRQHVRLLVIPVRPLRLRQHRQVAAPAAIVPAFSSWQRRLGSAPGSYGACSSSQCLIHPCVFCGSSSSCAPCSMESHEDSMTVEIHSWRRYRKA